MTRPDRKSNAEHQAAGTYRPDRHGKWDLPVERPMMPYKLNAEAKKVWKKVCDVMETAGTISKVDFFALELMCDAIVMYRKAHAQLSKEGFMIEGNGRYGDYQKPHPAITVRNDAFKQILSILKEFGMTPAARGQRPNSDAGSDQAKKDLMAALNPNA